MFSKNICLKRKKKIFVCPLDWGLGHATRCVPVIRKLLENDVEVIIGADKYPLAFLKQEFPNLQFIPLPGYEISYPESGNMAFKILFSIPKLISKIIEERKLLKEIIFKYNIDGVISDNRYGLFSKYVKTVFITHQIRIKSPVFENLLYKLNRYFIKKFTYCWVPDFKGSINLSGELSHGNNLPENTSYIGPLSRFVTNNTTSVNESELDVLFLISGPEPQRGIFEQIVFEQLKKTKLKSVIILGKPSENNHFKIGDNHVFSHLKTQDLAELISKSKFVISRSGYSTIMDMAVFGKKCIFVPTPGQTEQVYLADYFHNRGNAFSMPQSDFDLVSALKYAENIEPFKLETDDLLLDQQIKIFLSDINK